MCVFGSSLANPQNCCLNDRGPDFQKCINDHRYSIRSGKELPELERKVINPKKQVIESVLEESNQTPSKKVEKPESKLFPNNPPPYVPSIPAILQKKLPPNLKDPGSFMIPCTIGNLFIDKTLCDLGASINLMSLSVFRKLGHGEAKPTTVSLHLVDRSIKYPRGIIEDVLIKVDKFIFPADFIILGMDEDQDISIILG
ncbi:hypothetical protein Pfo_013659 [Paulownia fortunei]|nr:hypothetical protein Pfo_013659 [Paulownia fortunei]